MRWFATLWTVAAGFGVLAGAAQGQGRFEDTVVKRMLGKDYDGAKVVAVKGGSIVTVQLKTHEVKTLVSFKSGSPLGPAARPCWSPDGRQVLYVSNGQAHVVSSGGGGSRAISAQAGSVRGATWWTDPGTKELCVVLATSGAAPAAPAATGGGAARPGAAMPPPAGSPATFLYRLKSGKQAKLLDFACTGGMSRDGAYIGHAGRACAIVDLKKKKVHRINRGRPGSDASMSPDNTSRLLFLPAGGETLSVRNRYDREVWRLAKLRGSGRWRGPRWSNHTRFCIATADFDGTNVLVPVKISDRKAVALRGIAGSWSLPDLWLPSPAATVRGPIDHLVLIRLNHYKEKVAKAKDYSPIIAELKRNPDPEASKIVAALESHGRNLLSRGRYASDALASQAIYRDLATRYSRHEIGAQARRTLGSAEFRTELVAAPKAVRFEALRKRLHKPPGKEVKENFYDEAYSARNRAVLVRMVGLVNELRQMNAGTKAYERARYYAGRYGLPKSTSLPGNERLTVTATVTALSAVPSPEQIAPAKDAVIYVRYRVEDVTAGKYSGRELVAVHWAVRFGRTAPAAKFRLGQLHDLSLDLFDAHPELEKVTASRDANNHDLAPYWALSAKVVR